MDGKDFLGSLAGMFDSYDNKDFCISFELFEVISLVIKRQKLLRHIEIVGDDKYLQDDTYHLAVADCARVTAKLEKLIVKKELRK